MYPWRKGGVGRGCWKSQPSNCLVGSPGNTPILTGFPKVTSNLNSGVVERSLLGIRKDVLSLWNNFRNKNQILYNKRYSFHLYCSGAVSGARDEEQNICFLFYHNFTMVEYSYSMNGLGKEGNKEALVSFLFLFFSSLFFSFFFSFLSFFFWWHLQACRNSQARDWCFTTAVTMPDP